MDDDKVRKLALMSMIHLGLYLIPNIAESNKDDVNNFPWLVVCCFVITRH